MSFTKLMVKDGKFKKDTISVKDYAQHTLDVTPDKTKKMLTKC